MSRGERKGGALAAAQLLPPTAGEALPQGRPRRRVLLPLPLAGEFAKAYDGPPTDPKVFEENQKKLQEELQKRAEEQRKKLEAAGVPGAANPAAK